MTRRVGLTHKMYRDNPPIGKTRHSVSFHDGVKRHADGSPFFDLRTFRTGRDKESFIRDLEIGGYNAKDAEPPA